MPSIPLHEQFGKFVGEYAPLQNRVAGGSIRSSRLNAEFGYWVHPERYACHMKLLLDSLGLDRRARVLSACSWDGLFEVFLAKHVVKEGSVTAFFKSESDLRTAKLVARKERVNNVDFRLLSEDARELKAFNAKQQTTFDAAISIASIHTMKAHALVIEEMQRALKPGSKALVLYSPHYMKNKFKVSKADFEGIVSSHFSVLKRGTALKPSEAERYYRGLELDLRKKRGFGITQKYLLLSPKQK